MAAMNAHSDCWFGEPCADGATESCPKARAEARRDKGVPWSQLETRREPGGLRHYLDGEPVHCGVTLELQTVEPKSDDYGEYLHASQRGVLVRYEATFQSDAIAGQMHVKVGGYSFGAAIESHMRFRWPRGGMK